MYSTLISIFLILFALNQHLCNGDANNKACILIGCLCTYDDSTKLDKVLCKNQSFDQLPKRFPPAQPIRQPISLIDISNNNIENIPDASFAGLRVGVLDLSRNQISSIGKRSFVNITALDTLQLASNSLTELGSEVLVPVQYSLRSFVLSLNAIANSNRTNFAFTALEHLEHLDLSHNKLVRIPRLNSLGRLRTLIVNENHIETLEPIEDTSSFIQHLTTFPEQLEELHLRGNRLTSVNLNWLANLFNLQILDLSNNQISYINKDSFRSLVNLKQLLLNNNNLNRVPSEILLKLNHLSHLDLSFQKTAIVRIENYAFDREQPETKFEAIILSGNEIEEISNLAFCSRLDASSKHVSIANLNLMRNKLFNTNPCVLKQLNANRNARYSSRVELETSYEEVNHTTPVIDCYNCDPISYLRDYRVYLQLQITCMESARKMHNNRIMPLECNHVEVRHDICAAHSQFDCYRKEGDSRPFLNNNGTSVQFGSIGVVSLLAIVFILAVIIYTC